MEEEEKDLIRSRLSDLVTATICGTELLAFLHEQKILSICDLEAIATKPGDTAKAMQLYSIIKTRKNGFAMLLQALKKTGQSQVLRILNGEEPKGVQLSEKEVKSRVRKMLGEEEENCYGAAATIKSAKNEPKSNLTFDVVPPVELFTGREKELNCLHKMVTRSEEIVRVTIISQMTSVSGLGGIGKTQLARQYVLWKGKCFDGNVIWLNAESETNLSECFRRLANEYLDLTTKQTGNGQEKSIGAVVKEVYNYFKGSKALFVFDNAEKVAWLRNFLPFFASRNENLFILITSRHQEWEKGMEVFELREFSLEDATSFVIKGLELKEVDRKLQEDISKLVNRLQCFPLALQQAISYIHDQQITKNYSIEDYLFEFERLQFKLLSFREAEPIQDDYIMTTTTTWAITVNKIKEDPEHGMLALCILNLIAYINPARIKRDLFYNLLTKPVTQIDKAMVDEEKVSLAVRLLVKYSIINAEEKHQSILSIHRLVQEVTRIELNRNGQEVAVLGDVLTLLTNTEVNEYPAENVDHALMAWSHAWNYPELIHLHSSQIPVILARMNRMGVHERAIQFGEESLLKLKECNENYFRVKIKIAEVLRKQGKMEESLRMLQAISEKAKSISGKENNLLSIDAEHQMGITMFGMGKYEEAPLVLHEVYEQRRDLLGADHKDTLAVQRNYATSLYTCGRMNEALKIHGNLIQTYKNMYGESHPEVWLLKIVSAGILHNKGEYEEALKVYEEVYQQMFPIWKEHADLFALLCCNLGFSLNATGKYDEALEILEGNFENVRNILGEEHIRLLIFQQKIGDALRGKGEVQQALDKHRNVYKAFISRNGEDNKDTLDVKKEIANDLSKLGYHEESLSIFKEVIEKLDPASYFYEIEFKMDFARAIEASGKGLEEALQVLQEVKVLVKKVCGEDSPIFAMVCENLTRIQNGLELK